MITEEEARKQLETLHKEGKALAKAFADKEEGVSFEEGYQSWYSRALPLMKQLALDRYWEFQSYYFTDPKYAYFNTGAYVIQDYFRGRETVDEDFDPRPDTLRGFRNQLAILKSITDRLAWSSIESEDQAERGLQLALLETARGLIAINERAAGVLAGTVLEIYLRKLAAKHKLKFRKQTPLLREYIDALHTAKIFDVPVHAQAIWLAEIDTRSRAEGEAPTKLQVRDLVDGTRWLITNVF
ncbi:MAG TPA: hypothetical protein VF651_07360 [Gammaproteobacteria bacterium]